MNLFWSRTSRSLFVVLAALVALILASGCGDDGENGGAELSIQDYLQGVHSILRDSAANTENLVEPLQQDFPSDEEALRAIQDYCDALMPILRKGTNSLNDMEPPAEAVEAHNELLASVESLAEAFEDLGEQAADAHSLEEIEQWSTESGWNETYESFLEDGNRACLVLQGLADENSLALDFECVEDEGS